MDSIDGRITWYLTSGPGPVGHSKARSKEGQGPRPVLCAKTSRKVTVHESIIASVPAGPDSFQPAPGHGRLRKKR